METLAISRPFTLFAEEAFWDNNCLMSALSMDFDFRWVLKCLLKIFWANLFDAAQAQSVHLTYYTVGTHPNSQ